MSEYGRKRWPFVGYEFRTYSPKGAAGLAKEIFFGRFTLLAALAVVGCARAGVLAEKYGEAFSNVPDELIFDCSSTSSETYQVFGRDFRAPANFRGGGNGVGIYFGWDIPLSGGLVTVEYASIRVSDLGSLADGLYEFPPVSDHHENTLGVYVLAGESQSEDGFSHYSTTMVLNGEVLTINSLAPIRWDSLFECFD